MLFYFFDFSGRHLQELGGPICVLLVNSVSSKSAQLFCINSTFNAHDANEGPRSCFGWREFTPSLRHLLQSGVQRSTDLRRSSMSLGREVEHQSPCPRHPDVPSPHVITMPLSLEKTLKPWPQQALQCIEPLYISLINFQDCVAIHALQWRQPLYISDLVYNLRNHQTQQQRQHVHFRPQEQRNNEIRKKTRALVYFQTAWPSSTEILHVTHSRWLQTNFGPCTHEHT